ncbi:kinase-like domain-containing protein [Rhizophagus clarus]|uniref:Kinase-like domain-containing protein n=1 Tax=Rhizophagus clarus TaxID=94130 RepID=A0A8H3KPL9_9GLOM|nr:kinase-like domain-containing protein [Rhizophagus clarus]
MFLFNIRLIEKLKIEMNEFLNLKTQYKFKVIFSKSLRKQIKTRGVCSYCKKPNTGFAWCDKCDPGRFLKEGKTSGNPEIDKFIHEAQLKTSTFEDNFYNIEWIPYDRFQDIKQIGRGGFADIFSAIWLDGKPNRLSKSKKLPVHFTVVLKKLKTSDVQAFINEIKILNECSNNIFLTKFYGITKDPQKEGYIMVMEHANEGDLRFFLKKNFSNLKWKEKLHILSEIAMNLDTIHKTNYIHKDLHCGNILQFRVDAKNTNKFQTKITDLGNAQLISSSRFSNASYVCGILPYIAPEVLNGMPYTFESDIYSFGIIMIEITTGRQPYNNVPHDENLALRICNGLRPRVAKGTPQCYIDLVNQCLDAIPENRPKANELSNLILEWIYCKKGDPNLYSFEMHKEFIEADEFFPQGEIIMPPEEIYISRHMRFTNLPEPRNSIRVQVENFEVSNPELIEHLFNAEVQKRDQDVIEIAEAL